MRLAAWFVFGGLLAASPASLDAQQGAVPDSWTRVQQVPPRQTIEVTLAGGEKLQGTLVEASAEGLALLTGRNQVRSVPREQVLRVTRKSAATGARAGVRWGLLAGAAATVALAIGVNAAEPNAKPGDYLGFVVLPTMGLGIGAGAAIGAAAGAWHTVYQVRK